MTHNILALAVTQDSISNFKGSGEGVLRSREWI